MAKTIDNRNLLKRLRKDGWYYVRTKGSHNQYKHSTKEGLVTIKQDVPTFSGWLLKSIEEQSGIKF